MTLLMSFTIHGYVWKDRYHVPLIVESSFRPQGLSLCGHCQLYSYPDPQMCIFEACGPGAFCLMGDAFWQLENG